METKKKMYRQGDLLLIEVGYRPPHIAHIQTDILMKGTVTGHHHRIQKGKICPHEEDLIIAYVDAYPGCKLVHDEHATIELPEGIYEVRRQREVSGYVYD